MLTLGVAVTYLVFIFQLRPIGQTHTPTEVLIQGVAQRVLLRPAINSYNAYEIFPPRATARTSRTSPSWPRSWGSSA